MALLRRAFLQSGSYWQKETRFRGKESKIRRQHADDLSRHGVHADVAAEDVWIGIKTLAPVGVGHDGHSGAFAFRDFSFVFGEGTTHRKIDPECREKIRRNAHDFCLLGRTGFGDDFAAVAKDGEPREGRNVAAPLVVIGQRRAIILDSGFRIGVEDRNEPIGLRKRKRTEEDRIYDPKNREVRSQADRDRGERGDRERRCSTELAKGEAKIVHEQTNSAHKVVTYSNADIAVYSLVIDSELELTFVLSAVEVAFRFCDESVVVDPPKFVAADAKAFSRAARSGIRSS